MTITACGSTGAMAWDIKRNMLKDGAAMPSVVGQSKWDKKTNMETTTFKLYKGYYIVGGGGYPGKSNYLDRVSIKSSGNNIRFVKAYYELITLPNGIDFDYLDTYYEKEDMYW